MFRINVIETSSAKLDASRVPPEKKDKEKQAELERIAKRAELDRLQREKQADQAARKAERDRKGSEKRESRPVTPFDTARMDELANAKLTSLYQQKVTSLLQKIKPQVNRLMTDNKYVLCGYESIHIMGEDTMLMYLLFILTIINVNLG